MLVLEIAGGVLLALLLYRGIVGFAEGRNMTIPAALFGILYLPLCAALCLVFLGFMAVGGYLMVLHPESIRHHLSEIGWGIGIFIVAGSGIALWAERQKI